jgi:hypothetical protein
MKRLMSIGLLAFAGVLAACGDNDPAGPGSGTGTFELELTGALDETADGPAWFGADENEEGDPVFVLLLGDGEDRHFVMVGKEGSSRPAVGSYPISITGWNLVHIVSDDEELLGMFVGMEGEITITHSSSSSLRGTIDFVATGLIGEQQGEVEGSVTFNARPATAAMMSASSVPAFLTRN